MMGRFDAEGWEWKHADKIVLGDYLPFKWQGQNWTLEVVKVEAKPTVVYITVEEPISGERWTTRPRRSSQIAFKEAATVIEEADARLAEAGQMRTSDGLGG
jgi:hypothetical protein